MFRPRVIPVSLLKGKGLVKSTAFKNYNYIGDPINAVKIYNDLKADELVFLDITASQENRMISLDLVKKIGEEANMPFAVGGGIKSIENIREVISSGAEKVIINSEAAIYPEFIQEASETFGSSTIVVCIDVKKKWLGKEQTWIKAGTKATGMNPVEFAKLMEKKGAGEIIIQSIERDGTMEGYDLDLIKRISESVTIPVVALGGAGSILDLKNAYQKSFANGLAAGSLFVYHGPRKGVLINYIEKSDLQKIIEL
jgi:cyclase